MTKKRKCDAKGLEEVERTMYSSFRGAANALSQLYTQATAHQKAAFHAGERNSLEKLYQWIIGQDETGSRVTVADIVGQIQNELECGGEDPSMSPRSQFPHQPNFSTYCTNTGVQSSSEMHGQSAIGFTPRTGHLEHVKNSVFSNALSSPVRHSLQPYHLAQGGEYYSSGASPPTRSQEMNSAYQNREANSLSSNDTVMDMYSDSPVHDSN